MGELFSPLLRWKCVALKTLSIIFALLILVPDLKEFCLSFFFFCIIFSPPWCLTCYVISLLLTCCISAPFHSSWWPDHLFSSVFISQQCVTVLFGAGVEPGVILTCFSLGSYVLSSPVCSYINTVLHWIPLPHCAWEKNTVAMQYHQDSSVDRVNFNATQKERYYRKQKL